MRSLEGPMAPNALKNPLWYCKTRACCAKFRNPWKNAKKNPLKNL